MWGTGIGWIRKNVLYEMYGVKSTKRFVLCLLFLLQIGKNIRFNNVSHSHNRVCESPHQLLMWTALIGFDRPPVIYACLNNPNIRSDQIRSVAQLCPTLCNPMNRSTPGLSVHHQLPEFTETHVHRVSDAIQPSHPLSSPSPPAPNPSQHQSLCQWVNSSHEVAKVLKFQL